MGEVKSGSETQKDTLKLVTGELRDKYNCRVPERREELGKLLGVGQYVAGAVLSIGYGKKEWIVDSNIVRLFRRYFGIRTSKEGRRNKYVIDMAKVYVSCKNPGKVNLALIDFASLVCRPHKPACNSCCLAENCFYHSRQEGCYKEGQCLSRALPRVLKEYSATTITVGFFLFIISACVFNYSARGISERLPAASSGHLLAMSKICKIGTPVYQPEGVTAVQKSGKIKMPHTDRRKEIGKALIDTGKYSFTVGIAGSGGLCNNFFTSIYNWFFHYT